MSERKKCDTCAGWSELVAQVLSGSPMEALCIREGSPYAGTYTTGGMGCDRWTNDPSVADHPSERAPAATAIDEPKMTAVETMKAMKIVGLADGRPSRFNGTYLREVDFEDGGGTGSFVLTARIEEARRFTDVAAVLELWRTASTVKPLRPDGKPNRLLTAFTIEIVDVPNSEPAAAPVGPAMREVTRTSILTGKTRTLWLSAPDSEWANYEAGNMLIQHALPSLSDAEREFVKTGITDEEWATLAPEDDEADEGPADRTTDDPRL